MSIPISDVLVPGGDGFAVVEDIHLKGGYRSAALIADLTTIPTSRRKEGMKVNVLEDGNEYTLEADLVTWTTSEVVRTTPQTLTSSQKIISRENIQVPALNDVSGFPQIAARDESVACGGYITPAAGGVFGMNAPVGLATRIGGVNKGNDSRINTSGTVTHVEFFVPSTLPADCQVWISIWREDSGYDGRWELIGTSGNLRGSIVANNTKQKVQLSTPIRGVEIGDCTGFELRYTFGSWGAGFHEVSTPQTYVEWTGRDYYWAYSPLMESGAAWDTPSLRRADHTIPIVCYMSPPVVTLIGDSRTAGYPFTRSLINSTQQYNKLGDMAYRLEQLIGLPCRNVGVEGNKTSQMAARFSADVLGSKPRIAVLLPGGYNDLYGGLSEAQYTTNVQSMIDDAIADGVTYVLVCSDMPFADPVYPYGSHNICIQNAAMDTRCLNIKNLCDTYPVGTVRFCDLRQDLGELRPSDYNAPAALDPYWKDFNVWNMKSLFWSSTLDRLHMSEAGASQMARTIAKTLRDWFRNLNPRTLQSVNTPVVYTADPTAESLTPTFTDLPCVAYKADGTAAKYWDITGAQWVP